MKYPFDVMLERHGKDAIAVDAIGKKVPWAKAPEAPKEGFDAIPMWVADMNFPTAPSIQREIIRRAEHPAFGYFAPTEEYYDSIIHWHRKRNGIEGSRLIHTLCNDPSVFRQVRLRATARVAPTDRRKKLPSVVSAYGDEVRGGSAVVVSL